MPYAWTPSDSPEAGCELRLWPHRSLPPYGFAAFILITFAFICVPLLAVIGTVVMWGLLPFILLVLAGLWWGLRRSYRDGEIVEQLHLDDRQIRLTRQNPRGPAQDWECNTYWARVQMHPSGGPVPHYVTLKGNGREVEIGAFLSEEERVALYGDLADRLRDAAGRD
ncbi:MAG: DUF2244 domain-containing protein [Paracoccaceae bacterium]